MSIPKKRSLFVAVLIPTLAVGAYVPYFIPSERSSESVKLAAQHVAVESPAITVSEGASMFERLERELNSANQAIEDAGQVAGAQEAEITPEAATAEAEPPAVAVPATAATGSASQALFGALGALLIGMIGIARVFWTSFRSTTI